MSDQHNPASDPTAAQSTPPPAPPGAGSMAPYQGAGLPTAYGQPDAIGKVRSTGVCILLFIVTLGFYSWYWYFATHDEMKRNTGRGIGGGIALLLAIFVGFVMPYINSHEVGEAYSTRGQAKPVSGATGLWYFPGMLIIIGPIVWFVKTNAALNDYWRSLGATG